MITAYHRPRTKAEALKLLGQPATFPLGGGTTLNRPSSDSFAVVDLQALGLDKIRKVGKILEIGAMVTLQSLLDSTHIQVALKEAIRFETTYNLRQMATVAGTLVVCDGRSPFSIAMLALDAHLEIVGGSLEKDISLSPVYNMGYVLLMRRELLEGKLITKIIIPLQPKLAFETVARTPTDKPIICVAMAQWSAGRTRLILGGWGKSPTLAMDGNEPGGEEQSARNTCTEAADEWASCEYRSEMAAVLAKRCIEKINA